MAVVANPLVVRIFINSTLTGHENGWAERWPIWETNWNIALGQAREMVQARQRVLSSNAYIQWGCLGTVVPPYYEQTVVTEPLEPLPQWGPAAFEMQGILFDLNNTAGENAPRLFRAVEGTQVVAKQWVYADMPIPAAPPALPADLTTASKDLLWQNTLAIFRQYAATQQPMSDGHHGPGTGYWVDSFSQIVYRQMSSRRWGRPWKRMSWEAAPFVNAPQFSPCGCVVTVNRISYAIPCRFGPDWDLRWIHYYEADDDAAVMTFQTPFCCWNRSLEYTDFSGVGEAKKFQRRNWTDGSEWGAAPGVMWTGPPSYFEGWAPEPPIPTPGFMRPACDDPVVPPGQIAQGGAGGGGTGIAAPAFLRLELAGGAGAGGLVNLVGPIDQDGGLAIGGVINWPGILPSQEAGGGAMGGLSDLVGIIDGAGGLSLGGAEDEPFAGDDPGGGGMGGAEDLVGLLEADGGLGVAGLSDFRRVDELTGGIAAGGGQDLVGLIELAGGGGDGGSEDLPHTAPAVLRTGGTGHDSTNSEAAFFGGTTAGNLLVVGIGRQGGGTITAPAGWVLLTSQANAAGTASVSIYYYANAPSQGTVSFSFSTTQTRAWVVWAEISNAATTSPADVFASTSGSSTTISTGTTAPTSQAYTVAIAVMFGVPNQTTSGAWGNGYSVESPVNIWWAYKILTGIGTTGTSATLGTGSSNWAGVVATFKGA